MPGSLVKDDPEPELDPKQTIDESVVQKGQTFWGFLTSIFSGIAGVFRRINGSKKAHSFVHEIMQGKPGKSNNGWLVRDLERKKKRR